LNHSNIVKILDAIQDTDSHYLVKEYIFLQIITFPVFRARCVEMANRRKNSIRILA